jgi:hypothetical protein
MFIFLSVFLCVYVSMCLCISLSLFLFLLYVSLLSLTRTHTHTQQMDPEIDSELAQHVLKSHIYRKPGEAEGQALRRDIATTAAIVDEAEV